MSDNGSSRQETRGFEARRANPLGAIHLQHQLVAMWTTALASFRRYINGLGGIMPFGKDEEP